MTADERRRALDERMAAVMANHATVLDNQGFISSQLKHQHDCIEALKREVTDMVLIVEQVRQLLSALKGLSFMAKWATIVGGGMAAIWHGAKWLWLRI